MRVRDVGTRARIYLVVFHVKSLSINIIRLKRPTISISWPDFLVVHTRSDDLTNHLGEHRGDHIPMGMEVACVVEGFAQLTIRRTLMGARIAPYGTVMTVAPYATLDNREDAFTLPPRNLDDALICQ